MKFGKEFRTHLEETLPEWRDKFLCYKPLKKLLKHFPADDDHQRPANADADVAVDGAELGRDQRGEQRLLDHQEWFVRILNEELEKFNDFYVDKEEEFIIRLQELKERIEQLKEKSCKGGVFASESEFSDEMMDIRKDFVTVHGEMVLLKNYSSLNFAGLVKILKKYDKRTGGLLRLPFAQLALHQPFFTTEPLTRLVRECEANLELLFPLEAEVTESTASPWDQTNLRLKGATSFSQGASLTIGEETLDIYRSTLAAMKAIQGLQKASSTYNPLSFGPHFARVNDDSSGSVTAEHTPAAVDRCQEAEEDDAHSK
ncbi:SPX domain-containing protein 4 [Malania oleifera]|uniref:SPX domain-containing protein 4 n=1 Tax=Malania oleifera TaxID=397392 RepID=UPI0025AE43EE|nr:SPX domain-containing protein 4 [Malania oleifera]